MTSDDLELIAATVRAVVRSELAAALRPVQEQLAMLRLTVNRGTLKYRKKDAAMRLGISVRTVEARIAQGRLCAVREGKLVYVTEDACLDYEAAERR